MTAPTPALTALLDELDRLRAAATPGEWHVVDDDGAIEVWAATGEVAAYSTPADAAVIVAAVNAVPRLTAAVRAALALADRWDTNDDARYSHNRIAKSTAARALREALTAALEGDEQP